MANKAIDMIKQNFRPALQLALGVAMVSGVVIDFANSIPTLGYKQEQEKKAPVMTQKQQAALNYVIGAGY